MSLLQLKDKKWDKARIQVESVIRDTREAEAMEVGAAALERYAEHNRTRRSNAAPRVSCNPARILPSRVPPSLRSLPRTPRPQVIGLMCDLLVQRVPLIASEKACPADMLESVHTLLWAAPRSQVEELRVVREQLTHKYGDAFAGVAIRGEGPGCRVNEKVKARLTVRCRAAGCCGAGAAARHGSSCSSGR